MKTRLLISLTIESYYPDILYAFQENRIPFLDYYDCSFSHDSDGIFCVNKGGCNIAIIDENTQRTLHPEIFEMYDMIICITPKANSKFASMSKTMGMPTLQLKASNFDNPCITNDPHASNYRMFLKNADSDRNPAYDIGIGTILILLGKIIDAALSIL